MSTVQSGGGVMVRGMFSWHALDPLIPIEYEYQRIPKSIVACHVHPFVGQSTLFPAS